MAGQRVDMDRRVGRTADRRVHDDAVLERLAGQDVGGFEVFPNHLDDAGAGLIGDLAALAIGRGDRGTAGQRHAERFRQRVHGRGGAHGVAMTDGRGRGGHDVHELLVVDLARDQPLPGFPDHGSRTGALALMPAVQHRAARKHDRGHIDGCRRHQAGRRGLVAAGSQHHAVEGVTEQDLDKAEIGEIAVERRSRALSGLLDRMHREFHGDATGGADSLAHAVRQFQMMAVARRQIVAGLRNTDDRLARLQFVAGQPVIKVALEVERGHSRIVRVVEPLAGAKFAAFAVRGNFVVVFFHWFLPHCKLMAAHFHGSEIQNPLQTQCLAIPALILIRPKR